MDQHDPYTMELRLCDAGGVVSHEPPMDGPGQHTSHVSYLDRLNYLRLLTHYPDSYERETEPFACTGSAHLAGHHIRCTSPAHEAERAEPGQVLVGSFG